MNHDVSPLTGQVTNANEIEVLIYLIGLVSFVFFATFQYYHASERTAELDVGLLVSILTPFKVLGNLVAVTVIQFAVCLALGFALFLHARVVVYHTTEEVFTYYILMSLSLVCNKIWFKFIHEYTTTMKPVFFLFSLLSFALGVAALIYYLVRADQRDSRHWIAFGLSIPYLLWNLFVLGYYGKRLQEPLNQELEERMLQELRTDDTHQVIPRFQDEGYNYGAQIKPRKKKKKTKTTTKNYFT